MAPFHKSLDLKSFLIITLLLSALAGGVLFSMYNKEVKALKETRHITDRLHTNLTTRAVTLDLKDVFINLQFIANMIDVRSFMTETETRVRKDIEEEFIRLCEFSKDYDQIRLLDKSGMEILRVNNNDGSPAAVPPNKLQDKGSRYYFQEAIVVEPGEIYVSPFDLNIENGKIELPLKPMIRFATPVYNADGQLLGLVILNYLGQEVLDSIMTSQKQHDDFGSTMLLNNKGYWLLHPDKKKEWGFMYDDRQSLTFQNEYPIIWKTVKNATTGQIKDDYATYTFSTIVLTPQETDCDQANRRVWKLIRDLCTANPTLLLFNYLIYYAIISPSKGGRHGYSAERTSVG
ncbi:Multi-sensor hybrid histidine kinase (fragment) [Pseudodesulfovibrio profundus]|uniref:Multi-sensor hybrid histidine kinase n=1 Tax=Pseudodesulfovibrio profundus TaxID=57320 RepID=A0A2C8FEI3_9BACT